MAELQSPYLSLPLLFVLTKGKIKTSLGVQLPTSTHYSMSILKVFRSVLTPRPPVRSSSSTAATSSRTTTSEDLQELSMGPLFDRIPADVFLQIIRFVGPRDAARASAVCRGWNYLVKDNILWISFLKDGNEPWDSVLFAEMHLRSKFPSMMYLNHLPNLSFMSIYGQRKKVQGGSGYCKYGYSKYPSPSGRCATFVEFGNIESPMYSSLRNFYSTIFSRMQVKPSKQPVVVSIPICHSDDTESARASRRQLREAVHSVLFDMNVPAVCAIDQAMLALYSSRRTSGIVVNIGYHVTSVVPILQGKVMRDVGIETVGQGALKLTGFLRGQMQRRNVAFGSLFTVRTLKERLCYVAADYDAELCKNTEASVEVAGEGWFTLSKERFQTGEILFQPQIGGLRAMGLHSAVALCMDHCSDVVTGDDSWFKTVVLAGGTSCLPGLSERLEKELLGLLPPSVSDGIKVLTSGYGADSAWFGAKIISNVSTFPDAWCTTKEQFQQKFRRNTSIDRSW